MKFFDIISESPKTCIFQKYSNKTNLGGILTVAYLIFLISIIVGYMYDYYVYDQYQYNYFYKKFLNDEQIEKKKNDFQYNPPLNFSFEVKNKNNVTLNNNFTILITDIININDLDDMDEKEFLKKTKEVKMGEIITKKVDEFLVILSFRCKGKNCTSLAKKNKLFKEKLNFTLSYSSKIIDFESSDSPVINQTNIFTIPFITKKYFFIYPIWEFYNYEEQIGIFSRLMNYMTNTPNNWTFGQIVNYEFEDNSDSEDNKIIYDNESDIEYKIVSVLYNINVLNGIHLYKRKAITLIDYFANIAALCSTVFNLLTKIFGALYSKNFDNYKIVENILSKEIQNAKLNKIKYNKIESEFNLETNLIENNLEENKDNSLFPDKDSYNNENEAINKMDNITEDENDYEITKLPKLRFYEFFFNLVYSKCCTYIKRQKLIDSCSQIMYKYFSVENILYNQILFENLISDYHWNNPKLKSIHKKELILELNKYV